MRALLCPGQGSQRPGMLAPWLSHPAVAELVEELGRAAGLDLAALGSGADGAALRDTAVAQPLIVATSVASAVGSGLARAPEGAHGPLLIPRTGSPDRVAGHSLGGLTALAIAGALTPAEAVHLAAVRGRAMARCAAQTDGGMTALVGGDRSAVLRAIEDAGLAIASLNGPGQVVASGTAAALRALVPPAGTRARPLPVAGAFHSPAMATAAPQLREELAALPRRVLRLGLVRDDTGAHEPAGRRVGAALTGLDRRLTEPVDWEAVQRTLLSLGTTRAIELAPAGVLIGLARRGMPGVEVTGLDRPV